MQMRWYSLLCYYCRVTLKCHNFFQLNRTPSLGKSLWKEWQGFTRAAVKPCRKAATWAFPSRPSICKLTLVDITDWIWPSKSVWSRVKVSPQQTCTMFNSTSDILPTSFSILIQISRDTMTADKSFHHINLTCTRFHSNTDHQCSVRLPPRVLHKLTESTCVTTPTQTHS